MKHIYLIGNGSRAAQYGVGTYIRQMLEFFRQTSSVRLTTVSYTHLTLPTICSV